MKESNFLLLSIVLTFLFITNSVFSAILNKNLKNHSTYQDSIFHSEKVFIHFNKANYYSGQNVWFKTYLVSANSNRPDAISKIVHVDLIDPLNKIIASRAIKISNGGGEGEFYLPKKLKSGSYTVRAYTSFMQNFDPAFFFQKKIHIQSITLLATEEENAEKVKKVLADKKPDLQFFPEGGYMVDGQTSQVGFKIINEYGKGINISGSILDNNAKVITEFNSLKFGMGVFEFIPKKGQSYKALIHYKDNDYNYKLPSALKNGVVMSVTNDKYYYTISLSSSLPEGVDKLFFLAQQKGRTVSTAKLIGRKKKGTIKVRKNILQEGIVQFTLFDKTGKPLSERLVFVKKNQLTSNISINPSKKEFSNRELVTVEFELDSIQPVNISLAVTDISSAPPDVYGLDIKSHLLLNSELKGEIEQPNYYFDSKDLNRDKVLDLLMMTQGWRQFLWSNEQVAKEVRYTHEKGINFKGLVKKDSDFGKVNKVELSLTFKNKNELGHDETTTFSNGRFKFDNYHFNDSTHVIIQAKKYKIHKKTNQKKTKNPNRNYIIVLDNFVPPLVKSTTFSNALEQEQFDYSSIPVTNEIQLDTLFSFEKDYENLGVVNLRNAKIRIKERFKDRNMLYSNPSNRIDFETVNTNGIVNVLNVLAGRVAGVDVRSNGLETSVKFTRYASLTGGASPLFLVDNVPVPNLDFVVASDVSFIDVLKGPSAALYGSRASAGIIAVHTKRGGEDFVDKKYESKGVINFVHPGYYTARKFYEPNYKVAKPSHKEFDSRSTLHWNPTLEFNQEGKAIVSFYTADVPTTYRIEIQGITSNGRPIKNENNIYVK